MKTYQSFSSAETKKLGCSLARKILKNKPPKTAAIIALAGELSSGKTTFTQGFFRGLGIRRRAVSPTFIIIRRFAPRHKKFTNLYHIDAYRAGNPKEILKLNLAEIFIDPKNIVIIEWADKIKSLLPPTAIWVYFQHGGRENERQIKIKNKK